ncbi:MAG: pyruvate kinase, partial [Thiogranum sp.]
MKNPEIRKTKIVATIGPACDSVEMLQDMIRAGMNVARLNLSHGTHDAQYESLARIREAAALVDTNVAIMIDTRGIEIRTGMLGPESVELSTGDTFTLYTRERLGDRDGVAVSFKGLAEEVTPGTVILLDDGAIELNVESISGDAIQCKVVHGGMLRNNKSVNLPNTQLSISAVGPENREDVIREMTFATENDVDYIAASFVQSADDMVKMREILAERN